MDHNMNKNKTCVFLIFLVAISCVLGLCSCKNIQVDVHMFTNMQECQNILNFKSDTADIKIYDSSTEDDHIKDLKYEEFFGCKYICEELSFEIFAYSFSNSELAMDYFKNVTGKKNDPNPTFSDNSGGKFFNRVVVSDNKVYNVRCGKKCKESVIDFLNGVFSIELFN